MESIIIGGTILLGLYMAWTIGANDFANSMGDAVGSGAITVRRAVILGALCEFAGSTLVGAHVTDTVRKGIVDPGHFAAVPEMLALGMICALLASALWLHLATWMGMPVSTTHAIVGAVAGFGVVAAGWAAVEWSKMGDIVVSWFISPIAGGVLAFLFFKLTTRSILGREKPVVSAVRYSPVVVFLVTAVVAASILFRGLARYLKTRNIELTDGHAVTMAVVLGLAGAWISRFFIRKYLVGNEEKPLHEQLHMVERVFMPLVTMTSCSVAFAHGANDVANAIGPVAAILDIVRGGTISMKPLVPFWILSLGGVGIVVGLATYGYKVLVTIGTKITQLTPSRGVCADLATCITVLVCTKMSLPVSTTHTIVGAIIGIGLARGLSAVNRQITRDIFYSWFVTVPASALMAAGLFVLGRWLQVDALIRQAFPG
ncbi:MAG: anion permease [Verrucomicrobiota bacterium]